MRPIARFALSLLVLSIAVPPAAGGPLADAMARCLVRETTADERISLARWMFVAMARHPGVQEMSTVTDEDVDAANQEMAALSTDLLTRRCLEETRAALHTDGPVVIQSSFQVLGEVAATELMSHPAAAGVMRGVDRWTNPADFQVLATPPTASGGQN